MPHIIHRVGIKSNAQTVYQALASIEGLAHWWTEDVVGTSREKGDIKFAFKSLTGEVKGAMVMKVASLVPGKKVTWKCMEGPAEWIGTDLTFELSQQEEFTIVLFGHRNWKEEVEFMNHCSTKWAVFLLSLKDYLEKGKGKPSPNDTKIDNWN